MRYNSSSLPEYTLKALDVIQQSLNDTKCDICPDLAAQLGKYLDQHKDEILDPSVVTSLNLPDLLSSIFTNLFKNIAGKNPTIVPMDAYRTFMGPGQNLSAQIYRYILLLAFNIAVCIASIKTKEPMLNMINPDLRNSRSPEIVMAIVQLCSAKDSDVVKRSVERLVKLSQG